MKTFVAAAVAALSLASAIPADAQQTMQAMPRSNAAELPKVFAVRISVADLARSEAFYRGLGAQVHQIHAGESSVSFTSGPNIVIAQPPAGTPALSGGAAGFILQIADIDAFIARVALSGGTVDRQPNDGKAALSYGVRSAFIRDPDGVGIEVIQFPSAPPAAH